MKIPQQLRDDYRGAVRAAVDHAITLSDHEPEKVFAFASSFAGAVDGMRFMDWEVASSCSFIHQNTMVSFDDGTRSGHIATREAGDLLIVVGVVRRGALPTYRSMLLQAKIAKSRASFSRVDKSKSAREQHYLYLAWPTISYNWGSSPTRSLKQASVAPGTRYWLIPRRAARRLSFNGFVGMRLQKLWQWGATAVPAPPRDLRSHTAFPDVLQKMLDGITGNAFVPISRGKPTEWDLFVNDILVHESRRMYPDRGAPRAMGRGLLQMAHSETPTPLSPDFDMEGRGMTVLTVVVAEEGMAAEGAHELLGHRSR